MKYKLIKSYPNSRETGTIVSPVPQPDTASKTSRYIDSSGRYYGWHEVEDYPEYWEEIKEPIFKVGDWIYCESEWTDPVRRVESVKDDKFIILENVYPDSYSKGVRTYLAKNFRLATTQEIETHLIAEAKKRGFAKGVSYRYPDRPDLGIRKVESNEFGYDAEDDSFYDKGFHNYNLYRGGQWAEIVKEEEIKIGEYIARFDFSNSGPNTVSFGCKKYTFSEIISLYETCLVFGVSQVYAHNHLVEWMTIKKIYDEIKKQR